MYVLREHFRRPRRVAQRRVTQFGGGLLAWESEKALTASYKGTIAREPPAKIYDISPEV